ncbi:MAG: hydantoinase/oxoprolinase family protein [Pseudomonadota bacterium]
MRVGVEVGGTFTDLVAVDGDTVRVLKVPSTPAAPEQGAHDALTRLDTPLSAITDLVHGSTVATNAILERKGARVCLLVTAGTRDLLLLQRHNRRDIYDLYYQKPTPVVARRDTFEIDERVDADGTVVDALDPDAAEECIQLALAGADAEGHGYAVVAICLLNSYANPAHELALRDILSRVAPELPVTCSCDVIPVFREYERCSTTALAAYVQPVIAAYLRRFDRALKNTGFDGRFSIMQSNGGRLPADVMAGNAITSLFSGPAAGVVGAAQQAALAGFRDVITFDMGGTSTDVCLVEDARAQLVGETEVDGLPIKTPVIDIATVGAGGGSIVWVDDGGLLRVGPQSAGADPGPACYGRGGIEPTITDAHIVRGTVRPQTFLGGAMDIDAAAASHAFGPLAEQFGIDRVEAADSAIQVAEANIVRAIQRISTERGKDPRDYALVAFGGAGPMQAVRVAEELGLTTVVVPPHAGVLSALGLLASDYVHFESLTRRVLVSPDTAGDLVGALAELSRRVNAFFASLDMPRPELSYTLEMRYTTQAFEIPVEIDQDVAETGDPVVITDAFRSAHHRVFEFTESTDRPCEVVSMRVGGAVAPSPLPPIGERDNTAQEPASLRIFERGQWHDAIGIRRGARPMVKGPAVIEDGTSTIFVPAGWQADEHASGALLLTATSSDNDPA